MRFNYTDELIEYMNKKGKRNIIIEVATADGDFEVTELHTHFIEDKQVEAFIKRQGFHPYDTDMGKVLLPNYRLTYSEEVTFGIKKVLFFNIVTVEGVKL